MLTRMIANGRSHYARRKLIKLTNHRAFLRSDPADFELIEPLDSPMGLHFIVPVENALREVVEGLLPIEELRFREHPYGGHPYRRLLLLAMWLEHQPYVHDGLEPIFSDSCSGSDQWGQCPICGHVEVIAVERNYGWGICSRHELRWELPLPNNDDFSVWSARERRKNRMRVESYRKVAPFHL